MAQKSVRPCHPAMIVHSVIKVEDRWIIDAQSKPAPRCPVCGTISTRRHGWYRRSLLDLPVQGAPVVIRLRAGKWRCCKVDCARSIFTERLPGLAAPFAYQTKAVAEILAVSGHGAGGEASRRLLGRLGITVSGDTVLRHLKRRARRSVRSRPLRVVGVDEWAWRKGAACGTVLVDLEARTVADVLPERSSASLAAWLMQHPGVEFVCRDRHGLYAEGARSGAPQARQVADRFHLVQNLREQHLGGQRQRPVARTGPTTDGADRANLDRADRRRAAERRFARVHRLFRADWTVAGISRHLGLKRRQVDRWVRLETLPERAVTDPKPTSPALFHASLVELMHGGVTKLRWLFEEARKIGYLGSFSHMARYAAHLRSLARAREAPASEAAAIRSLPRDPETGYRMSKLASAAICMKPRPLLTERQRGMLDVLNAEVPGFAAMRGLALRFTALLRHHAIGRLERWLADAKGCENPAIASFARALRYDIDAVRNAVRERWSNGQTEGQVNKLKTLKRAMFGRAGIPLLRARMMPFDDMSRHQTCA